MLSISIISKNIDNPNEIRIINCITGSYENPSTISDLISKYLQMVERPRSRLTMLAYKNGLQVFRETLKKKSLDPDTTPIEKLTEQPFAKFIENLNVYSPATEQLYLQAVKGFYLFVDAEELIDVNQSRLAVLIKQRKRRPGTRIPQSLSEDIETLLEHIQNVENLMSPISEDEESINIKLRAHRDRAFLVTLADTGFRVHEACNLRRGDIDW